MLALLLILFLVVLNGGVSFAMTAFVRSNALCIIASTIISEMLIGLCIVTLGDDSQHPEDNVLLAMSVIVIFGTPVILGTSAGFMFLARRFYRRHEGISRE
jgi:hypothetical protein